MTTPDDPKMTPDQHRQRHVELHLAFDELFADYIRHHPKQIEFTKMPVLQLLTWSHQQTKNPTEGGSESEG